MNLPTKRITAVLKCRVGRVPGRGFTVTERIPSDKNTIFIRDEDVFDILDHVEKDFPRVETSLVEKEIDGKKYLVVATVWTPPESNDCFLLKWYNVHQEVTPEKTPPPQKWAKLLSGFLFFLILIAACTGILGVQTGYIKFVNPSANKITEPAIGTGTHPEVKPVPEPVAPPPAPETYLEYKAFVDSEVSELSKAFANYYKVDGFTKTIYIGQSDGSLKPCKPGELSTFLEQEIPFFKALIDKLRQTNAAYEALENDL